MSLEVFEVCSQVLSINAGTGRKESPRGISPWAVAVLASKDFSYHCAEDRARVLLLKC